MILGFWLITQNYQYQLQILHLIYVLNYIRYAPVLFILLELFKRNIITPVYDNKSINFFPTRPRNIYLYESTFKIPDIQDALGFIPVVYNTILKSTRCPCVSFIMDILYFCASNHGDEPSGFVGIPACRQAGFD